MTNQTFDEFEKELRKHYPNASVFLTDTEPAYFGAYFGIQEAPSSPMDNLSTPVDNPVDNFRKSQP